jgi:hypothetical protein
LEEAAHVTVEGLGDIAGAGDEKRRKASKSGKDGRQERLGGLQGVTISPICKLTKHGTLLNFIKAGSMKIEL